MRKRSKYRPKGVIMNTMAYLIEGLTPVAKHDSYLIDLKIKNHGAMATLTKGHASRKEIDVLIAMANICEALFRMGFGTEYEDVVRLGSDALYAVGRRGAETGRFILRAEEMTALNTLVELHDAQMDVITIKDMEQAIKIVDAEYKAKKMRPILEKQK
jgi:hypothetical protein